MLEQQDLICYLCGRENRIPPTASESSALRCGVCGALLVNIITCPACGTKNRVKIRFVEHQKILCGKCQTLLTNYQFDSAMSKRSASKNVLCNALKIEGKIHQWKGNWETAIQLFRRAQKYSSKRPKQNTAFSVSIGLCQAYLGNYESAATYLEHLDASALNEFDVVYELARVYGLLGDLEHALLYFKKARNLLKDTTSTEHLDDLLESLYTLREADEPGPLSLQTCILIYDAMRDYETNNIQAGVQKLSCALEINPGDPEIYQQLGIGLLRQGQFEQAVGMLERGLEFDPSAEQAQFALGDAYFHLGLYECALNAYKQTLHLNPHNIDAYHHLGLVYEQQGEIDAAKGYWEDVLKVNPHHKDALKCLKRHRNS